MKRLCFLALLFVLLAFPSGVRADVAPPYYPPGSNPQPGVETTQVRMMAETVTIEVQKDITPDSLGWAQVTADFTMRNLGTAEERMAARFPLGADNGWTGYSELGDLLIKVNGKQVQYQRANYPDVRYQMDEVPWAEFDIAFPVGKDVSIRVTYDLQGSGYYPFTAFYYILETGAGWKDTIGSADIILRLPYEANPQNVIIGTTIGWAETNPGGVFQGNEVRWHFDDFEPDWDQNMEFALVAPSAWQAVLTMRDNVAKHPNDGEVWGMLGKAYKEIYFLKGIIREDAGGLELYQRSVEAYEKCLSLKPDDAQWHAGFADLLARRSAWDWSTSTENVRALEEIHMALELAPNDRVVREVAEEMTYWRDGWMVKSGDDFDFPWLTQTPTPRPTWTPTVPPVDEPTPTTPAAPPPAATEVAQAVPTQTEAPEATPTSAPERTSPLCGSVAFIPLVAVIWFARKRK